MNKAKHHVVVMQSNYIPWKGYFDLFADADTFVFYDDVQFTKNDWRNRNQIKTVKGPLWLTVPVGQHIHRNINQVEISNHDWQKKHWKSIVQNYGKQSGFKEYKDFFENFYLDSKWTSLSEMNKYLIQNIAGFLKINVQYRDSTEFKLHGENESRLLDLLKQLNATCYTTGPSAMNYIQPENFMKIGIELKIKKYGPYPKYTQPFGDFIDTISILDLLFCCGKDSYKFCISQNPRST